MAIPYVHIVTGEPVSKEPWRWVAVFSNGDELHQFLVDKGGHFTPFEAILKWIEDGRRLSYIKLVHDQYPEIVVPMFKGTMPVHFYRNSVIRKETTREDGTIDVHEERIRHYCVGYEQQIKNHKRQVFVAVDIAGRATLITEET